jgi:hypothetical protein
MVRVREAYRKSELAGMRGIIKQRWGSPNYVALDVRLENGRSELFWIHQLEKADVESATRSLPFYDGSWGSCDLMLVKHGRINFVLPFGYYLESYADLLILRRADSSFVTVFSARGVDLFEVELTVWEDAD